MSIPKVAPNVVNQFQVIATQRGYNQEQSKEYVAERKALYEKNGPITNVAFIGSAVGIGAGIASKMIKQALTFKEAVKSQFEPLTKELDAFDASFAKVVGKGVEEVVKTDAEEVFKIVPKKSVLSSIKNSGIQILDSLLAALKLPFKALKGLYLSIPKIVRIPASILVVLATIGYNLESAKLDAKHDTIKYIDEKNSKAEVAEAKETLEAIEAAEV